MWKEEAMTTPPMDENEKLIPSGKPEGSCIACGKFDCKEWSKCCECCTHIEVGRLDERED